MYKFYLEINTDEHMLYPKEIAEMYGLYSSTGKVHSLLVKVIILDYLKESNIEYRPIFYNSRHGLKEVFSAEHYLPAFKIALSNNSYNGVYIAQNGKKYKYILKTEERY